MSETLQLKRTGWDVVLGILLIVGSLIVLGNVVLATVVSVLFIGWFALVAGLAMVIGGLMRIGSDFSWSVLLGGAALTVLGLFMVRNVGVAAIALTLTAGALFFATGLARIAIAFSLEQHRWLLILSGVISVGLGLWILVNPAAATLKLLGTLMGIQILLEGVTLLVQGRLRPVPVAEPTPTAPAV